MTATGKAHGLDGALVEPDWPPLTGDEVGDLLQQFPALGGPYELLTVSPRPFSAASVVATADEVVFVKRHARAVRDAAGLHEEHAFMQVLREHGVPVPRVFATRDGRTAVEDIQWTYEVHAPAEGNDLYQDAISWTPFENSRHAEKAGAMLARMHLAAEGYAAAPRVNRQLVAGFTIFAAEDPQAAFERYTADRPSLREYLRGRSWWTETLELLAPLHAELMHHVRELPPLWTHNDLHASNLFWGGTEPDAQVTGVIDFGLCDRTHAVHDLAHAIERNMVGWLALMRDASRPEQVAVERDALWALLRGYESVRRLSEAERGALAPMLAICHAEFALSEADYFLSVLRDEDKARVAGEDYLLGHARWWRGAGAELLQEVRGWGQAGVEGMQA